VIGLVDLQPEQSQARRPPASRSPSAVTLIIAELPPRYRATTGPIGLPVLVGYVALAVLVGAESMDVRVGEQRAVVSLAGSASS